MSGKALVIDDEKTIRFSFKKRLNKENIDTDVANGWNEAEPLVTEHEYDVIFLDIRMPGRDGIEILKEIMSMQPDSTVVMMTGDPSTETASEALKYGAVNYLHKPVTKNQLLKITFQAIERRHLILEKKELESKNTDYQHQIEKLISSDEMDIDTTQFREMAKDLVKHRQQSAKDLKSVQTKLGDALNSIKKVKGDEDGNEKTDRK